MRVCILLMRKPISDEDSNRIVSLIKESPRSEIAIYLLGDGVLCARKNQSGYHGALIREAMQMEADVRACARDLRARGISEDEVQVGIEIVEDFEGAFLEDALENSGGVYSW